MTKGRDIFGGGKPRKEIGGEVQVGDDLHQKEGTKTRFLTRKLNAGRVGGERASLRRAFYRRNGKRERRWDRAVSFMGRRSVKSTGPGEQRALFRESGGGKVSFLARGKKA